MLYHGSPSAGLVLDSRTIFLTKEKSVATSYADGEVAFCSKACKNTPTIYSIEPAGSMQVLDLRKPEHRDWYAKVRVILNRKPEFDEDQLPKLEAVGFVQHTGLPGYGAASLFKIAFSSDFDAVLLDEGSQGVSLAVFNPAQSLRILSEESV